MLEWGGGEGGEGGGYGLHNGGATSQPRRSRNTQILPG